MELNETPQYLKVNISNSVSFISYDGETGSGFVSFGLRLVIYVINDLNTESLVRILCVLERVESLSSMEERVAFKDMTGYTNSWCSLSVPN